MTQNNELLLITPITGVIQTYYCWFLMWCYIAVTDIILTNNQYTCYCWCFAWKWTSHCIWHIYLFNLWSYMYWLGYIIGKKKSTINFWIRKASCSQTVFSIYLAVKSSFFPLVNSILTKMYMNTFMTFSYGDVTEILHFLN